MPAKRRKTIRKHIPVADFYYLMDKQKGLCADKKCANRHGKRQKVSTTRDIDHKYPIRLWELSGKKGNVDARSNLQLLCLECHRRKNAEDKKKIANYKEKHPKKKKVCRVTDSNDYWETNISIPYK